MSYLGSSAAPLPVAFAGVNGQSLNGGSNTFTLSRSVAKTTDIELIINNVQQNPYDGSYSVSGNVLTTAEVVSAGVANVYVRYLDAPIASITPPDGTVTYPKLGADLQASTYGFKNRIINGAMMIDQRNAGASVTPTGQQYGLDRWNYQISQASKLQFKQNLNSVTPPAGFTNYLGVAVASTATVGAGDYFTINQPIEGYNVADFSFGSSNAQTVTLSFWVYSNVTGTFGGSLNNNTSPSRAYPFTYAISNANTWTKISVTIVGDTTGTWLTSNGQGLQVWFGLGVGSTFSGTAGSWAGSNYLSATGAASIMGSTSNYWYITGVQLEKGSTATSFDYRPYGTELALCQRYYEILDRSAGCVRSSTEIYAQGNFIVQKRAASTLGLVGGSIYGESPPTIAGYTAATPSITTHSVYLKNCAFWIGGFTGLVTYTAAFITSGAVYASSEL